MCPEHIQVTGVNVSTLLTLPRAADSLQMHWAAFPAGDVLSGSRQPCRLPVFCLFSEANMPIGYRVEHDR